MSYDLDRAAQQRLETYFVDGVGPLLRNKNQRASFALYALGILGEGERKSAEPIAARTVADPDRVDPMHQKLLHFQTKPELAIAMIRRAVANELPRGVVLADSAYGNNGWFREQLRAMGLEYGVAILSTTKVHCVDEQGVCPHTSSVGELARRIGRKG